MELEELRRQMADVDRRIVEQIAERQRLGLAIGRLKNEQGVPTRDFRQEREVLERTASMAGEVDVEPQLTKDLFSLLISSSLSAQERDRVSTSSAGSGRRALIIGGSGRMGSWFARFLASQEFSVETADPLDSQQGYPHLDDWRRSDLGHDFVVVATPLTESRHVIAELAERRPPGVVFDIASVKGPLRKPLEGLRTGGVRATSLHPMFGPDTELLSGRQVIAVDLGDVEATERAKDLFADTMATLIDMDIEQHDRTMAYVLGLSHALNLVFAEALGIAGGTTPGLEKVSSTTFEAQLAVTTQVASENPDLYFEIQRLNEHGLDALDTLAEALATLRQTVASGNRKQFRRLMLAGRDYLAGRTG